MEKIKKKLLALLLGGVLVSTPRIAKCELTKGISSSLSSREIAAVKEGIIKGLRDPDSAKFGNMVAAAAKHETAGEIKYVCGYINAKNSYGGYTGMTPYFGILEHAPDIKIWKFSINNWNWIFSNITIGGGDQENRVITGMCSDLVVPLD